MKNLFNDRKIIILFFNNFFSILIVVTISANVKAATYYVNNIRGNDRNSGLQAVPLKTLDNAINRAVSGDTVVIVSNGPYHPYRESLRIKHNGKEEKQITIRGEFANNKPYIIGDGVSQYLCLINNKDYINIQNIIFKDSINNHGITLRDCHNITLEDLEVRNIPGMSGIFVRGGGYIVVDKCTLSDIGNNGIALIGGRSEPLHNTIIKNCTISNIRKNDGITIHKGDDGGDVGSKHLIKNNHLSNCGEEGIDVTSGKDIIVENNKTFNNNIAGVATSWGVQDVIIRRHISENEKKFGIVINPSKNIELSNSIIENAKAHQLVIRNCDNFTAKNNKIISGHNSTHTSVITISPGAKNLVFSNNIFLLISNVEGPMLSFLKDATSQNIKATWNNNTWWNTSNNRKIISDRKRGSYYFDEFKSLHAPNDRFIDPNTSTGSRN